VSNERPRKERLGGASMQEGLSEDKEARGSPHEVEGETQALGFFSTLSQRNKERL